ncbi:MAG: rhodanese-like domain-containing protein [Myxococcota bacterium]
MPNARTILLGAAAALLTASGCRRPSDRISPDALAAGLQDDPARFVLLDVRSAREYRGRWGHIPGAISTPWPMSPDDLPAALNVGPDQTVVLICLSGHRSRWGLAAVRERVAASVVDLEGGMIAWWQGEHPVAVAD